MMSVVRVCCFIVLLLVFSAVKAQSSELLLIVTFEEPSKLIVYDPASDTSTTHDLEVAIGYGDQLTLWDENTLISLNQPLQNFYETGTITVIDITTGKTRCTVTAENLNAAFSSTALNFFAVLDDQPGYYTLDSQTCTQQLNVELPDDFRYPVLSPDGAYIALFTQTPDSSETSVYLIDTATGETIIEDASDVFSIEWSSHYLLYNREYDGAVIIDTLTQARQTYEEQCLRFLPGGQFILSHACDYFNPVSLWTLHDGQPGELLYENISPVDQLPYIIFELDGKTNIFDPLTGETITQELPQNMRSFAVSGDHIAIGEEEATSACYVYTGELQTITEACVYEALLSWSPDGNLLLYGELNSTSGEVDVRLYDVEQGQSTLLYSEEFMGDLGANIRWSDDFLFVSTDECSHLVNLATYETVSPYCDRAHYLWMPAP